MLNFKLDNKIYFLALNQGGELMTNVITITPGGLIFPDGTAVSNEEGAEALAYYLGEYLPKMNKIADLNHLWSKKPLAEKGEEKIQEINNLMDEFQILKLDQELADTRVMVSNARRGIFNRNYNAPQVEMPFLGNNFDPTKIS